MTMMLTPCGRGRWRQLRLDIPGHVDLTLLNTRITVEVPGYPYRRFWVRQVFA